MKKNCIRIFALMTLCCCLLSLCACGGEETYSNTGTEENGRNVWYLGGNNIMAGDVDVPGLFAETADTVDPASIYGSLTITEEMLHGAYTINSFDKDVKKYRKELPFEEVALKDSTISLTVVPLGIYMGAENIACSDTGYKYGEFEAITDAEVAALRFTTADQLCTTICTYTVSGNTLTFRQIEQTSAENEPFAYAHTGVEFSYTFSLSGPYLTVAKNGTSLQLKAYSLTDNVDSGLRLSGYSLLDSPLIDELDYFASSDAYNYAIRRDGSYYDLSAYKMDDSGRFTVYLSEKNLVSGESDVFTQQYAYIIQSSSSTFLNDFGIILLDGTNAYYYTDSITEREARVLKEQGTDVSGMTEEQITEIAEKKADLFEDLQAEFEAQGINVTIDRASGEIYMDATVLFGGDSAVVTDDGKALLDKFLAAYTNVIFNEKYDGFVSKTMVEGHTAPVAGCTYESDLPLSEERANNVLTYCLSAETSGKLAGHLEAIGYSNSKPVYGSDGQVDMAASRRVTFRIIVNVPKQ